MKAVPAGTVYVDVDYSGTDSGRGEGPFSDAAANNVSVPAFSIGETQITWELWHAVKTWAESNKGYSFANAGRQGGDYPDSGPAVGTNQHPVTEISWRDAAVWCNAYSEAAGKKPVYTYNNAVLRESEDSDVAAGSGKAENAVLDTGASGFRLPTEAQWEYAARGGDPNDTANWTCAYAGSNDIDAVAVYGGSGNGVSSTAPVKSKQPNSRGLYDMSGNVWEWCQDVFSGAGRVFRGGSWIDGASDCTLAFRYVVYLHDRNAIVGFRVVCP
jgi:formylglycine-generating enzyme required for sulfatase activity